MKICFKNECKQGCETAQKINTLVTKAGDVTVTPRPPGERIERTPESCPSTSHVPTPLTVIKKGNKNKGNKDIFRETLLV